MNQKPVRVFEIISFWFVLPLFLFAVQKKGDYVQYFQGVDSLDVIASTPIPYPLPNENLSIPSLPVYPPPEQAEATPTVLPQSRSLLFVSEHTLFLPLLSKSESTRIRFYAQISKVGTFYGVWGTINTAIPVIREPRFSYSTINIVGPEGHWVETGWIRSSISGCIPKFSWATQEGGGIAHIIETPLPTVGVAYWYIIERTSPGNWKLWINRTDGSVLVTVDIPNAGFDYGDRVQAGAEVDSPTRTNDMGVSSIRSLHWMDIGGSWHAWNGWGPGTIDSPYHIDELPPDVDNDVIVYGNNGNPIPPEAPCP